MRYGDCNMKFNKRITVHAVNLKEGSLFSNGIGFDTEGNPVDFIGNTHEMKNIKQAVEEFDDGDSDGRPTIWLKPWQWEDNQ